MKRKKLLLAISALLLIGTFSVIADLKESNEDNLDLTGSENIIEDTDTEGSQEINADDSSIESEDKGEEGDTPIDDEETQSEFRQAIEDRCDPASIVDLTESGEIKIDMPRLAFVNFSGTLTKMPSSKSANVKCDMEFFDGSDTYFSKKAIINAQGQSSMMYPKKNISVDLFDDEWIGDATPSVIFGDWVPQDGFHIKAYYTDYFRGTGTVGYELYNQMELTRGDDARIWQRAGMTDVNPNALGHPDGFPVIVYLNGDFYGVYAFQIKKHRDNYGLKKNESTHIHLDGELSNATLFNGEINWSKFEIRAPKTLIASNGEEYNGDAPTELIDSDTDGFDPKDKKHKRSDETKRNIVKLSKYYGELKDLEASGADMSTMKAAIEDRFDVIGMIDYICFSCITNNYDGFNKNWQWITYDGKKWAVSPYDLDGIFGYYYTGELLTPPELNSGNFKVQMFHPYNGASYWVDRYYSEEIKARYADLRKKHIFSSDNIMRLFSDWYDRIGDYYYGQEYARWNESPCVGEVVTNEQWNLVEDWSKYWNYAEYNPAQEYQPGDQCRSAHYVWEANTTVKGVMPYIKVGFSDSLERVEDWVTKRLDLYDKYFDIDVMTETGVNDITLEDAPARIFTIEGVEIPQLRKGINIVIKNGKATKVIL